MKLFRKQPLFGVIALFTLMTLIGGCQAEDIEAVDEQNLEMTQELNTKAPGPSASGHGTLSLEDIPPNGEGFRQFSFHARIKNNGTVDGNGNLTYVAGQRNLRFDIDCLNVIGNLAIMSGVITRDNQFPQNEGLLCLFEVVDNGEGAGASPDEISLLFIGSNPAVYDCANEFNLTKYEIEGGNIQVR